MERSRCAWCGSDSALYIAYHDMEWGVPERDEQKVFELLVLEGMQAGLSWLTVLKKRQRFREVFDGFDVKRVATYNERKIAALMQDRLIIRNRKKIEAAISNAGVFLDMQKEFGGFAAYIWKWVDFSPIQNHWECLEHIPASSSLSLSISKDLKRRGMNFVGPTIIYSFLQAIGVVNDHLVGCFRHGECGRLARRFTDTWS